MYILLSLQLLLLLLSLQLLLLLLSGSAKVKEEEGFSDWTVAMEVNWRVSGLKSLGFLIEFRVLVISEVAI
jgi:hypothetical protein